MSGGTTGHVANATVRNEEEYEAVHQYLTGYGPGEAPHLDEIDYFGLDVYFNTNGYTRRKARGWPLLSVPLERQAHVDLITRLLLDGFEIGGRVIPARYLQAQNALHRVLAGYYTVTGPRFESVNLDSVFGYGSHISRVWHERLRDLWGCDVNTSYGLTEFVGANAASCKACGALHYVSAWQEFLSPGDLSTVDHGDALLVLTSLVPFVTLQPRVRYVTHDLVTIQGQCPSTGLVGFQFRGRESSSVWESHDGGVHVLFSEIEVLEALDQLDGVNARRHPAEIQLWEDGDLARPPFRMGLPLFSIGGGSLSEDHKISLQVELAFSPADEPDRARPLEKQLVELLCAEVPRLGEMTVGGEAKLVTKLVPPRALRLASKLTA
jgi:hypothetical protein